MRAAHAHLYIVFQIDKPQKILLPLILNRKFLTKISFFDEKILITSNLLTLLTFISVLLVI